MAVDLRDVDPRELRVPPSRAFGADPTKLQRQIAAFGASSLGMPPLWAYEAADGVLVVYHGATRATRIAKLAPGTLVPVEVIGKLRKTVLVSIMLDDPIVEDVYRAREKILAECHGNLREWVKRLRAIEQTHENRLKSPQPRCRENQPACSET